MDDLRMRVARAIYDDDNFWPEVSERVRQRYLENAARILDLEPLATWRRQAEAADAFTEKNA